MPQVVVCFLFTQKQDERDLTFVNMFKYQIIDEERKSVIQTMLTDMQPLMPISMYDASRTYFENALRFAFLAKNDSNLQDFEKIYQNDEILFQVFKTYEYKNGCQHYLRRCQVKCAECEKFYWCKYCHDESELHSFRSADYVRCEACGCQQKASQQCQQCNQVFARYYCATCNLYDDFSPQSKPIFHCEKCGLCRVGVRECFTHCDKCSNCIFTEAFAEHNCKVEEACPVCLEQLVNSRFPRCDLPCGHQIHVHCYQHIFSYNEQRCPLCRKSLLSLRQREENVRRYKQLLQNRRISPFHKNTYLLVQCVACSTTSYRKARAFYFLCYECGDYSAHVLRRATKTEYLEYCAQRPDLEENITYEPWCPCFKTFKFWFQLILTICIVESIGMALWYIYAFVITRDDSDQSAAK